MVHVSFFIVVFYSSFESVRSPQKTSLTLVGGLSEAPVEWPLLSSHLARLSRASQVVKHLCVTRGMAPLPAPSCSAAGRPHRSQRPLMLRGKLRAR